MAFLLAKFKNVKIYYNTPNKEIIVIMNFFK